MQTISVCNQPPRSTHPGHPFVGRQSEYQQKLGHKRAYHVMHWPVICGLTLACYLWSHSISWYLDEGYRNGDQYTLSAHVAQEGLCVTLLYVNFYEHKLI